MAWTAREAGAEIEFEVSQSGERLFSVFLRQPTIGEADAIAQYLSRESNGKRGAYLDQRFVFGRLGLRVVDVNKSDGTPLEITTDETGIVTESSLEPILEFIPWIYQRALRFINRTEVDDAKN